MNIERLRKYMETVGEAIHGFLWPPLGITALRIPPSSNYEEFATKNGRKGEVVDETLGKDGWRNVIIPDGATLIFRDGKYVYRIIDNDKKSRAYIDRGHFKGTEFKRNRFRKVKEEKELAVLARDSQPYMLANLVTVEYQGTENKTNKKDK